MQRRHWKSLVWKSRIVTTIARYQGRSRSKKEISWNIRRIRPSIHVHDRLRGSRKYREQDSLVEHQQCWKKRHQLARKLGLLVQRRRELACLHDRARAMPNAISQGKPIFPEKTSKELIMTNSKATTRTPRKTGSKQTTENDPDKVLSCSCSAVQSASKSYTSQSGTKKESGSWNGASGADCTCDGKRYSVVSIAFPGSIAPDIPSPIDAASVIRPFAEVRRRFSEIMDEMDRALAF